ncbi:hypothetical protein WL240_12345, partial [Staphylococcus epidermidis]
AYSSRSFVLGSGAKSKAYGSRSGIINALNSETDKSGHTQLILNSNRVKSPGNYHVVGGYGSKGGPSTSNIKFDLSTY